MIAAAGLSASRFLHYAALTILFGAACFPVYTYRDGLPPAGLASSLRRAMLAASLLALASGILWLGFVTATMSGNIASLFDANTLFLVIRGTDFGRIWVVRLALAAGLIVLLLGRQMPAWRLRAVLIGSLILLASIAWTGHSGSDASSAGFVHRISDAFHLLAAGVWIGALAVLARLAMVAVRHRRNEDLQNFHHALARFSGVGTIVVATLVLTGINNPGFLASFGTPYGEILLVKLALFGAMLLLAAANRYWLTPRLASSLASGLNSEGPARALWASVLAETTLAALVLAAVGWLGTLAPAAQG